MSFVSTIEVVFLARSVKWDRARNEKDGVRNSVFLAPFHEKLIGNDLRSPRFKRCMTEIVCFGKRLRTASIVDQ